MGQDAARLVPLHARYDAAHLGTAFPVRLIIAEDEDKRGCSS